MDKKFCKNHPDRPAIKFCHNCNDSLCEDCLEEGLVYYYCRKPECYTFIEREINDYKKYYADNPRFCEKCIEETNSESMCALETFNFIGTTMHQFGVLCPTCRSKIYVKRYVVLGIPIKSYGLYRVIHLSDKIGLMSLKKTFISRKMNDQNISRSSVRNIQ
jgi:hypothetical protein